jgi:hypothetical protein
VGSTPTLLTEPGLRLVPLSGVVSSSSTMDRGHGLRPDWGLVRLRQGGVGLTLSGAKCNYFFYFFRAGVHVSCKRSAVDGPEGRTCMCSTDPQGAGGVQLQVCAACGLQWCCAGLIACCVVCVLLVWFLVTYRPARAGWFLSQVYVRARQGVASCAASVCLHVCGLCALLLMASQGTHLCMCSTEPLRPETGYCQLASCVGCSGVVQGCGPAAACASCLSWCCPLLQVLEPGAPWRRRVERRHSSLLVGAGALALSNQGGCSWGLPCE